MEEIFELRAQGLDHLERGELREAEEAFQKLVSLAPREPLGHANLGLTYLRAGRYSDAEAALRRALRLDPESPEIELAMARLYWLTGRAEESRSILEKLLRRRPGDVRALYALAELDERSADLAAQRRREERLREIVARAPTNLAVRLQLVEALARRGEADSVVRHLEEIRPLPPELPREARDQLERSIELLREGKLAEARRPLGRFQRIMEVTPAYQASFSQVKWAEGPLAGRSIFSYTPAFLVSLRARGIAPTGAVRFTDATADVGLGELAAPPATPSAAAPEELLPAALAVEDFDGDGMEDLFFSWGTRDLGAHLYAGGVGSFSEVTAQSGISLPSGAVHAAFADFDNDGRFDLLAIGGDDRIHVFRNSETGRLADVATQAGLGSVSGTRRGLFADLDHDGDLDLLLLARGRLLLFRNNLDGTFTEVSDASGLASGRSPRAVAFGDFDDDGLTDLFVANEQGSDLLFRNTGHGRFADVTAQAGIASASSGAVAIGDYDNDGWFDVFVASALGEPPTLWRNEGYGTFVRDERSASALSSLRSTAAQAAQFVDYDNDGWLDLVVVGHRLASSGGGLFVFHNEERGVYRDRSGIVPPALRSPSWVALVPGDFDYDGDQDLLVAGPRGVGFLRNQGGNARLSMRVQLAALRDGSGKNNVFGIGAKVELRAGELYQSRIVTRRVTHFGLGSHLKGDVLRVQWPNGVPQIVYLPGTDQDVLEVEQLKGSCAFLYTWDGERFRFVTDVMWRSALGMPLGIMAPGGGTGGELVWAPASASREYFRIPGEALRPRGGRYVLQLTEELWETAYLDELRLIAVDHPDSVQVFVDERFVPPTPEQQLRLFPVVRAHPPRAASFGQGEDVLPRLQAHDFVYVSDLKPLRYQGLVEPYDIVLDLGEDAGKPGTYLFLRGWIYPTDASINLALSQQSRLQARPPSLEVRDPRGRWVTAIPDLGFPAGKDKTLVIDLAGKFPTEDHRVRIRTNMQIYWDQAFVAAEASQSSLRITPLVPLTADLHFRGFSRMYRRGGRYGPHWFDYDQVSREPPWRPIEGAFTRFGDVLPLLLSADDRYVVMGPGDELTLEFDATSERELPPGWTRTFFITTVSWMKDADLNTALGNTVEPLPFHGMKAYPYAVGESYPRDSAHQRYLREYNTRVVKRR